MDRNQYRTPAVILMLLALGGCGSSSAALRTGNPAVGDPERGQVLYEQRCEACHGREGNGTGYGNFTPPPADLTSAAVQTQSDRDLLHLIHEGKANTAMPAWKWALSEEEARDIVAYLRTLERDQDTRR